MPANAVPSLRTSNGGTPSWEDRLREAAYTSPSGTRIRFDFESVSREVDKRTASFQFPGVDDAYVQSNGHGARKYPLRCFFWGAQHDRLATTFEAALLEEGIGRLEHPLYGTFDVVPYGTITRRDDLKSEANQSVVEVTFWTSVRALYPAGLTSPRNEVLAALDGFDAAAAAEFEAGTDLRSAVAKASLKATVTKLLREVSAVLEVISAGVTSVNRQFRDAQQAVNFGMDVLVGQPLLLAQQITDLVRAPARAAVGLRSRMEGYQALAARIASSPAGLGASDATLLPSLRRRAVNDFRAADLVTLAAVSGTVTAALETKYVSKPEAIAAADAVLTQFDTAVAWRDGRIQGLGVVDPGGAYQALLDTVARTAGYLVATSFALPLERRIVLDRPRTIIDLAAELYGSVDDRLDLLIQTNDLTGSEILELPRGRTIAYYV